MSNVKFTPGPWEDGGLGWIDGPGGTSVVEYRGCGSHKAEWRNASDFALALAAPALYEALKYARRFLNDTDHDVAFVDAALAMVEKAGE